MKRAYPELGLLVLDNDGAVGKFKPGDIRPAFNRNGTYVNFIHVKSDTAIISALVTQVGSEDEGTDFYSDATQLLSELGAYFVTGTGPVVDEAYRLTIATASDAYTFTLPATGTNDCDIDWGDGTVETVTTVSPTHTYATAGAYQIAVTGTMTRIYFNNGGDKDLVISLDNWGNTGIVDIYEAYHGCSNMVSANLSGAVLVGPAHAMFYDCSSLPTIDFTGANCDGVTSWYQSFRNCSVLNCDLTGIVTETCTLTLRMLQGCAAFNGDISGWDTSKVTNAYAMFYGCGSFTQDISYFDVSSLANGQYMLTNCTSFGSVNLSNVYRLSTGWPTTLTAQTAILDFSGYNKYDGSDSDVVNGRAAIVALGWTVNDGGAL